MRLTPLSDQEACDRATRAVVTAVTAGCAGEDAGGDRIGVIRCPRCGGTLHFCVSGDDNHISYVCSTDTCVKVPP